MQCRKCHAEIPDESKYCMLCGANQTAAPKRKALRRPNGTGTVYKLSGRRHRPWAAAKNKVVIGYYETKTAALEALNKLSGRDISERYNMTFSEVFEAWKTEHYKEIAEAGRSGYDTAYKQFKSLHNKKFRDLRTSDFQKVINKNLEKSFSSLSKYKQLTTQMSRYAMREEIISTDFAHFVKLPENVKKEKEVFTEEDIKKLENNKSETARIILMLLSTGMRIGELFSLKLSNYHGNYVIGGEKTAAGRDRVIPIKPEGREHFSYFARNATGDKLLSGYTGQKNANNFRKRDYYPLLDKLEIERKTPHATRHTFATMAVKEGVKPEILQRVLGHADYSTTANIYTHIDADTLISAICGEKI